MCLLLSSFYNILSTSRKILYLCITTYSLSCAKFFSKIKLVKTYLFTQSKQANLKSWLHILRRSPQEGFNDTAFQHFVEESNLEFRNNFMEY